MQKTIKTDHYSFVITDGTHEELSSGKNVITLRTVISAEETVTYLNSDVYTTKDSQIQAIFQYILSEEMGNSWNEEYKSEEEMDYRAHQISGEMIEILKQI